MVANIFPAAIAHLGALAALRARTNQDPEGPAADRRQHPDREPHAGDEERHLCCSACGAPVTTNAARSEQAGRHEHVCTNPDGLLFRIGCFAAAPGCLTIGRPTSRWTWFPGYRWQVCLCAHCGAHLGWRFRDGGGSGFFGLILIRVVDCGGRRGH